MSRMFPQAVPRLVFAFGMLWAWLVFPNGNGKVESHANIANRGWYPLQIAAGMVEPMPNARANPKSKMTACPRK